MIAVVAFLAIAGPTVAAVIFRQKTLLATKYTENANLILQRESEANAANSRAAGLQAELDLWQGKANPWRFWPPTSLDSPARQQAASLLRIRQSEFKTPADAATIDAMRLLALATLQQAVDQRTQAVKSLELASRQLEKLVG
ncbi:MAG TPA: hypothetical protein VFG14_14135, partial [Chthoniobacteraceae bacterium]|nr:hypothetical protein [Chthoniobacteraceae bacterium]